MSARRTACTAAQAELRYLQCYCCSYQDAKGARACEQCSAVVVAPGVWAYMATHGSSGGQCRLLWAGVCAGVPARLQIVPLRLHHALVMSMPLVLSAWADNALRMVRALVRVARAAQVLGQSTRAVGKGRGARAPRASTHQATALALRRSAAIASPGSGFELNADFEIIRLIRLISDY